MIETKRDTKDFRIGTCALGKGVLKERRFLHTRKPLTGGIRRSFGTSEWSAVQQDRCSKGKMEKIHHRD